MPGRRTPSRTPLDRSRVLVAGVALADREGLDGVSMRALAALLGVVPMALYKHVADKEHLVNGMVDTVVASYEPPPPARGWRETVRARVLNARRALRAHPWLRQAIETRTQPSEAVLRHMDTVAGDLIGGGLSVDLAHYAMHALGNRIWGYSPEAFTGGGPPAPGDQEAALRAMAEHFPHVTAIALDAAARNPGGACDEEHEFAFTLDLLLDAVERLHASGWSSRRQ